MIRWVSQAYHQYQKSTLSFYFQVSLPLGGQCTSSAGIGTYVWLEVSLKCTQVHPGGYMPTKTQYLLSHFQDSYSPLGVFLVGECYGSISVPSRVWVLKETMLLTSFTWILAQQDKILVKLIICIGSYKKCALSSFKKEAALPKTQKLSSLIPRLHQWFWYWYNASTFGQSSRIRR